MEVMEEKELDEGLEILNLNNKDTGMDLSFLEQIDTYTTAPGFERGLRFDNDDDQQITESTTTTGTATTTNGKVFNIEDMFNLTDNTFDFLETKVTEEITAKSTTKVNDYSYLYNCIRNNNVLSLILNLFFNKIGRSEGR